MLIRCKGKCDFFAKSYARASKPGLRLWTWSVNWDCGLGLWATHGIESKGGPDNLDSIPLIRMMFKVNSSPSGAPLMSPIGLRREAATMLLTLSQDFV